MKRKIKLTAVLCTMILTLGLLCTGCGSKVEKPEVMAEAYCNLYILGDSTKIEANGLKSSEAQSIKDLQRKTLRDATKKNFTTNGLKITDEQLDGIIDAQIAALAKLTIKTETVSTEKNKATVKITMNYVDITKLDEKAATDALEDVKALQLTSQQEVMTKYVELYVNKLLEGLKTIEPSTETVDETFDFDLKKYDVDGKAKELWGPSDMKKFGLEIGKMAVNNK